MENKIKNIEAQSIRLPKPTVTAIESVHDFGNVAKNTLNIHNFVLRNDSDKSVIITNARASCGCTAPTYEKGKVLFPGDITTVTANYTSPNTEGPFAKSITVNYNWEIVETNKAVSNEQKQFSAGFTKLEIKGTIV